ncbi:MAG: vWA domain-containing protein [Nanoarchaeota archaeon]
MTPNTNYSTTKLKEQEKAEELSGKLQFQNVDDKLMHSVIENDKETIDDGKLLNEAINNNISGFNADLMFENLVNNYNLAKQIYGPKLIKAISGFNDDYIEKNIHVPEFQNELKKKMNEKIKKLKKDKLLNKDYSLSDKGIELTALISLVEEIDKIESIGNLGNKFNKKPMVYGEKMDIKNYKRGNNYKDISIRRSIKTAIKRGHKNIQLNDLKVFERQSKGKIYIIYALDSSASMKGDKIDKCKKAGVALAYKAINEKDEVGLIIFGKEIQKEIPPTNDFSLLLKEMISIKAYSETDISKTINKAIELFHDKNATNHLVIISDALVTSGNKPKEDTIKAASKAAQLKITISFIGINLDKKGEELAKEITEIANGKLYSLKDNDDIDMVILEDYYSR